MDNDKNLKLVKWLALICAFGFITIIILVVLMINFSLNKSKDTQVTTESTSVATTAVTTTTATTVTTTAAPTTTTEARSTERRIARYTAYIFPNSGQRYLDVSDLEDKTMSQIRIGRNEIYARHGYIFKDPNLRNYFEQKTWYTPRTGNADAIENEFNKYERYNVEFLKSNNY